MQYCVMEDRQICACGACVWITETPANFNLKYTTRAEVSNIRPRAKIGPLEGSIWHAWDILKVEKNAQTPYVHDLNEIIFH